VSETQQEVAQPGFGLEKIYVKDASVEIPNAPEIFLEREAPQIEMKLQNSARQVGEGTYEAVLTVTLTAKVGQRTAYLVEVAQAGIFRIVNVPEDAMQLVLQITCPNMLFSYAREAISSLIGRAGFVPVYLQPVNFETLYQQQQQQQAAAAQPAAH
jgi:preprotein translocase subunit SecB